MKEKKTRYISPKKGAIVEICAKSQIVEENLPLKYVAYPEPYGTFFGFSKGLNENLYFCSCSENAIENFIQIAEIKESKNEFFSIKGNFPFLYSNSIKDPYFNSIIFKDKICHSCNQATPTLRYCHEMYGGNFRQFFGWYINQEYFRLGISSNFDVLENKCPTEILELIQNLKGIQNLISLEKERIRLRYNSMNPNDLYLLNKELFESTFIKEREKQTSLLSRKIKNKIENITRQDFGFSKIGSSWISESILHKIISRIFSNHTVERNIRPVW